MKQYNTKIWSFLFLSNRQPSVIKKNIFRDYFDYKKGGGTEPIEPDMIAASKGIKNKNFKSHLGIFWKFRGFKLAIGDENLFVKELSTK